MESASLSRSAWGVRRARPEVWAAAGWAALIVACWAVGTALNDAGSRMLLDAPPLFGVWDLQLGPEILVPATFAAIFAATAPGVAREAPWPALLAAAAVALAAWAVALAVTNGSDGLIGALDSRPEYLSVVPLADSPGQFLSTFLERIDGYPLHVRGHPPGMALILLWLDGAGLGGPGPAAALMIAVGATAPVAALIALREVSGEAAARRAAPFAVLLPAAVYVATSADALYMGVGAWAVAALVVAIVWEDRGDPRTVPLAVAGGGLFGVVIFLSYGLLLLGAIPLAVAIAARTIRPPLLAAAGVAAVVAAFAAAGFWWFDGLLEVREQYEASVARRRPYAYFAFDNLAAFALVLGPAVAIALARLRDPRAWLLVGGGLAAVLLADLSGMSKAEVERIWLPFVPWVALAACALPTDRWAVRALLGTQAAVAIVIEVGVASPW